jgi:hypothetical protein
MASYDSSIDGPIRIIPPAAVTPNIRPSAFRARPVMVDSLEGVQERSSTIAGRRPGRWQSTPNLPLHHDHNASSRQLSASQPNLAFSDSKFDQKAFLSSDDSLLFDQPSHSLLENDNSFNTETRQISNSSDEAVAPPSLRHGHDDEDEARIRSKVRVVVFEHSTGLPTTTTEETPPPPQRSSKSLAYALRRTDSGSTFQSLDGLSNAYPLIRKEARKRKEEQRRRRSSRDDRTKDPNRQHRHRKRPSSSGAQSKSRRRGSSSSHYFDTGTFPCFAVSCLPMDSIIPQGSYGKKSPSMSSFQYQEQRSKGLSKPLPLQLDKGKLSTREELLRLKMQLRELRRMASPSVAVDPTTVAAPPRREVRFAAPLVTQVTYRPYTEPEDIALLYFQEEELEALECDREEVSGDQFECQYDEAVMTVRIAYQKLNPADE